MLLNHICLLRDTPEISQCQERRKQKCNLSQRSVLYLYFKAYCFRLLSLSKSKWNLDIQVNYSAYHFYPVHLKKKKKKGIIKSMCVNFFQPIITMVTYFKGVISSELLGK